MLVVLKSRRSCCCLNLVVLEALRHLEVESMMRVEVLFPFVVFEFVRYDLEGPQGLPLAVLFMKEVAQVQVEVQWITALWCLKGCISVV